MPPSILFLIKSNPQKSHRPAEAIRIAVGLGTGKNPLTLILAEKAPLLLNYESQELEDSETIERYLPILKEWMIPFYVEQEALQALSLDDHPFKVEAISTERIAQLISQADRHFIF
jgi:sulfur relay (sulfurtransferase) DsrF/TusC family protein